MNNHAPPPPPQFNGYDTRPVPPGTYPRHVHDNLAAVTHTQPFLYADQYDYWQQQRQIVQSWSQPDANAHAAPQHDGGSAPSATPTAAPPAPDQHATPQNHPPGPAAPQHEPAYLYICDDNGHIWPYDIPDPDDERTFNHFEYYRQLCGRIRLVVGDHGKPNERNERNIFVEMRDTQPVEVIMKAWEHRYPDVPVDEITFRHETIRADTRTFQKKDEATDLQDWVILRDVREFRSYWS